MNSETPETDKVTFDIEIIGDARSGRVSYPDGMGELVDADFARRLELRNRRLVEALHGMVDRYTALVNCGDCGNWDPEEEEEVVKARAALITDQQEDKP